MGGTDIDNVCIALDTMIYRMKGNPRYLVFGKERLELPHCHSIVLSIVKCDVANLNDTLDASST